jgi:hypothetical protein
MMEHHGEIAVVHELIDNNALTWYDKTGEVMCNHSNDDEIDNTIH